MSRRSDGMPLLAIALLFLLAAASSVKVETDHIVLSIVTASWCKPCHELLADLEARGDELLPIDIEVQENDAADRVPLLRLEINGAVVKETHGYRGFQWLKQWLKDR